VTGHELGEPLRVVVLGTGYLGVSHAVGMAEFGFEVLGVDVDTAKITTLADGSVPFFEPDLEPALRKHVDSGRLRFTTSYTEAAASGDVFFICVGTPQRRDGLAADVSYVEACIRTLGPLLTKPCLVIGKSTVPVGTAEGLTALLAELSPVGVRAELAWNPEFLREGHALEDTLKPDRLVLGVCSPSAEDVLRMLYSSPIHAGTPVVVTDLATAELVKVAANAFLATKISFINAMAEVCEATGADVTSLADALGYDPRIGRRFLNAGLGFGGGCLPKDIRAFMARAGELGVPEALTFLREVDAINMRRRTRVVEITRQLLGGSLIGRRIGVLGVAFKPESDDVRDSPALNVSGQLQLQGASVRVYDPKANDTAARLFPTLDYADTALDACKGADVVLHLTEWQEFRHLDPRRLADVVNGQTIVDARNCLDAQQWRDAGWLYRCLGRP
jgi:UDPglucose 6-dehydrogenase